MHLGSADLATRLARRWVLACAILLPLGPAEALPQSQSTERTAQAASSAAENLAYLMGPSDVLQVFVWKEPELSRDVTVRLDGQITVPLLGDVTAAGRTPRELSADLEAKFARFLAAPKVTVGVTKANAAFYVIGQVASSGEFPLTGALTVLQALAVAGGFKDYAKTDDIVVVRRQRDRDVVLRVNYKRLEEGKDIAQNIRIRPGDTIIVP